MVNCVLEGNAGFGVGKFYDESTPVLTACLFHANSGGDFVAYRGGQDPLTFTGANSVNLNVPEASRNVDGDPKFNMSPPGVWTAFPQYDVGANLTTMSDFRPRGASGTSSGTRRKAALPCPDRCEHGDGDHRRG